MRAKDRLQRKRSEEHRGPEWPTIIKSNFIVKKKMCINSNLGFKGMTTETKAQTLPPQLGEVNSQPVGPSDNQGSTDIIHGHASPNNYSLPTKMVKDQQEIIKRGDNLHVREGCNNRTPRGRNSKRFLLEHVSSPKKDEKVRPESICPVTTALQYIQRTESLK